jgi:MoaA/NifB/PqqE/SkfB family radical SAM enzyme
MEKLPKMFAIADKPDIEKQHTSQIQSMRNVILDENNVWHSFIEDLLRDVDTKLLRKFVKNFFINATFEGGDRQSTARNKYGCNVPWAILMDPTSACNLSCTGCWAAHMKAKTTFPTKCSTQSAARGRSWAHTSTYFPAESRSYASRTSYGYVRPTRTVISWLLPTEPWSTMSLCEAMLHAGNFALAFSIEGDETATDMRRGKGTYRKVIEAMEHMRRHKLLFGYSTCYHRYNTENVGSDEFVDDMIRRGCRFSWNFTYIPIGKDARTDFLATSEQRAYMYRRVCEIRKTKPLFAMDFWNDGEYAGGCIAGGRRYLHINAAGDIEPCAFIHYSNVNIHDVSLLEALQSPLFKAYQKRQPFNNNHLRPCPLLDNPETLAAMVKTSGAKSTDMQAPEDVDVLCSKTAAVANEWAIVADKLWKEKHENYSKVLLK